MQLSSKISSHLARARHQLGRPLTLGNRNFKLRGYHANRLATDFTHEPYLLAVLQRLLSERQGTFIDVGVNLGQTLIKVLSIDASRPYLGLEPQLECSFFVDQFIRDNELTNAHILPIALSNSNMMMQFFSDGACDELASTIPGRGHFSSWVPARIGDEVLEELGIANISALKIDVEGAELQVLLGLANTLHRTHTPVLFEVLPNFTGFEKTPIPLIEREQNSGRAAAIWNFFKDIGYTIAQIDGLGTEISIERFELDDAASFIGYDYIARFE